MKIDTLHENLIELHSRSMFNEIDQILTNGGNRSSQISKWIETDDMVWFVRLVEVQFQWEFWANRRMSPNNE